MTVPPADPTGSRAFVETAAGEIHAILTRLITPGTRGALLPVPRGNWGDHAIWLGTRRAFTAAGIKLVSEFDVDGGEAVLLSPDRLRARLDGGVIFIMGGGWLGDLYPRYQALQEQILTTFPDLEVVQLAQSIHFERTEAVDEARRVWNAHPRFTLIVRDQKSLEFARRHLDVPTELCPDLAFALGPLARPEAPIREVLWLSRTDGERVDRDPIQLPGEVIRSDWAYPEHATWHTWASRGAISLNSRLRRLYGRSPRLDPLVTQILRRSYPSPGRARVSLATRFLSQGRAVVTDRLHGHILSVLLDLPHVVLDNRIGKLRSYYETWTSQCTRPVWADDAETALRRALELADSDSGMP